MKYDLYDFDGTIYDGDSGVDLVKFAIKKNPKFLLKFPKIAWYSLKFFLNIGTKEEAKNVIFSFLKDVKDIDAFVIEFWEKHEHKMKQFWIDKKDHSKDIIISASGYFWLKPIADKYKVKDLIATNIDPKTGEVIGKNCHGKQKVKLFYESYPKDIVATMYTDSVNDLPLIEEAKQGYLVKKDVVMPYYDYKPNFITRTFRAIKSFYKKNNEICNYLVVGAITVLISIAIKWGLYFTVLDVNDTIQAQIGVWISWIAAVIFAYITNRTIVFKSKNKKMLKESLKFLGSRIATLIIEMGLTYLFFNILNLTTNAWVIAITFIIQVIVIVLNYILSKVFVFKKAERSK